MISSRTNPTLQLQFRLGHTLPYLTLPYLEKFRDMISWTYQLRLHFKSDFQSCLSTGSIFDFRRKKKPHCELDVSLRATSRARAFKSHQTPALNPRPRASQNHSTQDSRVVPHRGTNWAALRLTAQIGRDAVLSESYGRGY